MGRADPFIELTGDEGPVRIAMHEHERDQVEFFLDGPLGVRVRMAANVFGRVVTDLRQSVRRRGL